MGKLLGLMDRVETVKDLEDLEVGTKATVVGFTADRKVGIRVDETNQLCYVPFESLRKIEV